MMKSSFHILDDTFGSKPGAFNFQIIIKNTLFLSLETENEKFLNSENSSDSDDSDTDCVEISKATQSIKPNEQDTLINELEQGKKQLKEIGKLDQTQSNLIDVSICSSTSTCSESDEQNLSNDDTNIKDLSHNCTYFEKLASDTLNKCSHVIGSKSLRQKVCINCEFVNELKESLGHMAFLSPNKGDMVEKNPPSSLEFDSPTILDEVKEESLKKTENIDSIVNDTISEPNDDTNLIINDTLSDLESNQASNDLTNDNSDENNDDHDYNKSHIRSFYGSQMNATQSNESTLILSDSDYENNNESYSKRRRKISKSNEESFQYFSEDSSFNLSKRTISADNCGKKVLSQNFDKTERWFCPYIQPPLSSDLDKNMKANNDPIVNYLKVNDKFKMVF
jgi:hypothetical protein